MQLKVLFHIQLRNFGIFTLKLIKNKRKSFEIKRNIKNYVNISLKNKNFIKGAYSVFFFMKLSGIV